MVNTIPIRDLVEFVMNILTSGSAEFVWHHVTAAAADESDQ